MNALELAREILAAIEAGRLEPDAIVVRPLCMCDQDVGCIQAEHLDQVVRRFDTAQDDPAIRIYRHGNVEPSDDTALTLKLG